MSNNMDQAPIHRAEPENLLPFSFALQLLNYELNSKPELHHRSPTVSCRMLSERR